MDSISNAAINFKKIYDRDKLRINTFIKLIVFFFVYLSIFISDYSGASLGFLSSIIIDILVAVALACLSTFLPAIAVLFIISVCVAISLSSSIGLSLLSLIGLITICLLFASLSENVSKIVLFTICCFYLRIPYVVPIYYGIKYKFRNIFSVIIGIVCFYFIMASNNALVSIIVNDVSKNPLDSAIYGLMYIFNFMIFSSNFINIAISFIVAMLICKYLKYSPIDYNREFSIIVSSVVFVVFAVIHLVFFGGVGSLLISIVSILVSMIVSYFLITLDNIYDYSKSEKVFFQDDKNVYYVKVVPKVK